jgi:iron complex transport system ATP-binding protein
MHLSLSGVAVDIDARPIVADVDLDVEPGSFTALVGPNGSGKSTLLRTIYRALRPSAGAVRLGGEDTWALPAREAARRRAVVTQHQLTGSEFTVHEVVVMGRNPHKGWLDRESSHDRRIVGDALARVGLAALAPRAFSTLSGGERQRVLLARALAQQAPLIVLDEPTNHLDVRAQLDLLDLVRDLGVTTVAALHDLDHAAAYADRVAVLHDGRLVATGPPLEVLTPELIAEVFGVRAHVGRHPLSGRPHIALARLDPPTDTARVRRATSGRTST